MKALNTELFDVRRAVYRELSPAHHEIELELSTGEQRTIELKTVPLGELVRSDLNDPPSGREWTVGPCSLHIERNDPSSCYLGFQGDEAFAFDLGTREHGPLDVRVAVNGS